MQLSTTIKPFLEKLPFEEIVGMLSASGFDAIDFPLQLEKSYPANEKYFREIKTIADSRGLNFNQTHAPFKPNILNDNRIEDKIHKTINAMKFTNILEAPIIVIHPLQSLTYTENADKLFDLNMEFFNELIPYAKKYGLKIAMENLHQKNERGKIVRSVCSSPDEYIRYLSKLNSEYVVACLDIGHAILCNEDPATFIEQLGDKLKALHIHENDEINDLHFLPYACGTADWERISKALKNIGYQGDFTFEAVGSFEKCSPETLQHTAQIMANVGNYLRAKIRG